MKYTLTLLCVLSFSLFACRQNVVSGEGSVGAQNRDFNKPFEGIDIENALSATVTVDPAAPVSVTINGYENLLPHIKTEVSGKTLKIFVEETYRLEQTGNLNIQVTMPRLNKLEASGASKIEAPNLLRAAQLAVEASGASEIMLANLQVDHLKCEVSGASLLVLSSGALSKLEADISGASKLEAFGTQAADARIDASGASKANVSASQTLQADASGASVINYRGNPRVKSQASGAASVSRAE